MASLTFISVYGIVEPKASTNVSCKTKSDPDILWKEDIAPLKYPTLGARGYTFPGAEKWEFASSEIAADEALSAKKKLMPTGLWSQGIKPDITK